MGTITLVTVILAIELVDAAGAIGEMYSIAGTLACYFGRGPKIDLVLAFFVAGLALHKEFIA